MWPIISQEGALEIPRSPFLPQLPKWNEIESQRVFRCIILFPKASPMWLALLCEMQCYGCVRTGSRSCGGERLLCANVVELTSCSCVPLKILVSPTCLKAASTALPARLHLWALYSLGAFPIIALSNESEPTRSQRDEKNVSEHFVITLKYKIIIRKFFLALWLAFHTTLLILEGWELVQESLEENSR